MYVRECVTLFGLLLGDGKSYGADFFTACRTGAPHSCINFLGVCDDRRAREGSIFAFLGSGLSHHTSTRSELRNLAVKTE